MTTGKASDKRFVPTDASSFSQALPEKKFDSSSEAQEESQAFAFEEVLLQIAQQTGKGVKKEKAKTSEKKPKSRIAPKKIAASEAEPVLSSEQIEDLIYKARGV